MGPYVLLLQHLSSILSSEIQHLISDPLHRVRNAFHILGGTIWISDHILFPLPSTQPIHKLNTPTHQPLPQPVPQCTCCLSDSLRWTFGMAFKLIILLLFHFILNPVVHPVSKGPFTIQNISYHPLILNMPVSSNSTSSKIPTFLQCA